jgi:hypothetical protein
MRCAALSQQEDQQGKSEKVGEHAVVATLLLAVLA